MASFTLSSTSTLARTLASGETGFLGVNGALSIASGPAVDGAGSIKLTVLGAIQAFNGQAVDHDGTTLRLDVGASGYLGSSTSDTVSARISSAADVTNHGTIQSGEDGLDLRETDGAASLRVFNHGSISARSDGMVLQSGSGNTTVFNTGEVVGLQYGIFNAFSGQSGTTTIINSGKIVGEDVGYGGDDSTETIRNSGEIIGGIELAGGDDVYRGANGKVVGVVAGEDGNDKIFGGAYDEEFSGGAGNDELRGRGGDDKLLGDDGEDKLFGGTGNDNMSGGTGDDVLRGKDGDDALKGNAGADKLAGGRGNDTLSGGGGNDVFVIRPAAGNDTITDFANNKDKIDITSFGLRPSDFGSEVAPALSNAGGGSTRLDLTELGGEGVLLIDGLSFANADSSDFIF
ncbi:calcium-binding protein [Tropicimonas marinistellae]|uniref:calcium-binding protein n=1 Tax=Tropicimonas marinistellae TaxID=1739787 RepID=UPI0008347EC5|nr:calcium-binding protein [Tropicimonas marinistellae]